MSRWTALAIVVFIATRLFILFGFGVWVTDVPLYQAAGVAFSSGLVPYCDYWFPYPPLALPLVHLPAFYSTADDAYRDAFRVGMLLFDVLCFAGVWAFLKARTACDERRVALGLTFFCLLGPAMGHLIYDRLDIALAALFIWALFFLTAPRPWGRPVGYLLLLAGALMKLLPLFLLPLLMILEAFSDRSHWPNFRAAIRPVLWIVVPFAVIIFLVDQSVCGRLIPTLAEQGARGIQIESNWALPLIAMRIAGDFTIQNEFVYGAFHILDEGVNPAYLFVSKYAGFTILLGFYVTLALRLRKSFVDAARIQPVEIVYLFFLPLLVLIVGQRVLSPQYLIWLMPLAAIQFAVARRPAMAIAGGVAAYGLTYVVFDLGFFAILEFNPWYSLALLARNLVLVVWLFDLAGRSLKAIRVQRAFTVAGA